ncbi:MAG: hypothetical protein EAZ37_04745 [Burkholderiales bacterium]|nr:MAG: hypothetical protein EAZ37_04745 [Burkholderiales bacterium]
MSVFRLAVLIIAVSLLSACSAIKLAYNQAPDLSYWWLDGYFDFNEQQTPIVREELSKLFAWHRSNELPKTAQLLSQAAQLMPGEVSLQQACALYSQGRGLIDNITNQALPYLADMAPTLTTEQIAHLKRKYAKNADEFSRNYIKGSAASIEAKRVKQAVDRSEMIYGKLEEAQIAAVKKEVNSSAFDAAFSLKERQRRQQELIDILTNLAVTKANSQNSQQAIRSYIQRAWESPDLAYRAYSQRLTQQACQSFANVHASTTAAQRANAVKVLKGYETDMRTLSASR